MAGAKFEYDESGNTFFYFLFSFFALILLPLTYYLWPKEEEDDRVQDVEELSIFEPCRQKIEKLRANAPMDRAKKRLVKLVIIVLWVILLVLAYKVSQLERDHVEYNPYEILGLSPGATDKEIKKKYRELSRIHHPDQGGSEEMFMKITKAAEALTDPAARENWEKYGNPDGPGAMMFGIAFPAWIVSEKYSKFVLAAYALAFMVILPLVVGMWWYKSIRYTGEKILLDTTQLYFYFFHKTPNMVMRRAIMILGASLEFSKMHNPEIEVRPSDNYEVTQLMKELSNLGEKNREGVLSAPFSIKARALIHAALSRTELNPATLGKDRDYILKKTPQLLREMIQCCVNTIVAMRHQGRGNYAPRLNTVENCMKLCQLLVQGVWEGKNPLLQLPYIEEDMLRHFCSRKRNIRSVEQFLEMKEAERRNLLRNLTDMQYQDVVTVAGNYPFIEMDVNVEVMDDEDKSITAGAIVTVRVVLRRQPMQKALNVGLSNGALISLDVNGDNDQEVGGGGGGEEDEDETPKKKAPVWKSKGKQKQKPKKKPQQQQRLIQRRKPAPETIAAKSSDADSPVPNGSVGGKSHPRKSPVGDEDESSDIEETGRSDDAESDVDISDDNRKKITTTSRRRGEEEDDDDDDDDADVSEDEDDWEQFQQESQKERVQSLETKTRKSHVVYCPYFPAKKQEAWWCYVADTKRQSLISAPFTVTSLESDEDFELKFPAPDKPGIYTYAVCLKSDSYIGFDQQKTVRLDVKEAQQVESHPQWDQLEEETQGDEENSDVSDFTTDDEDSND